VVLQAKKSSLKLNTGKNSLKTIQVLYFLLKPPFHFKNTEAQREIKISIREIGITEHRKYLITVSITMSLPVTENH